MKLILVRHGESIVNAKQLALTNGLTDKGKVQARKVARYLSQEKIEHIYCSKSIRCVQTMEEILKRRDEEDIKISFSLLVGAKNKNEDWQELQNRINLFIEDLKIDYVNEETILVVSHAAPIKMFVFQLTGEIVDIDNASATIFEISDRVVSKVMVNETGYLT